MKLLYALFAIVLVVTSGCVTTKSAPKVKMEVGEAHGIVNNCPETRILIIDGKTTVKMEPNTAREIIIPNGSHKIDFWWVIATGPQLYSSWVMEAKPGQWLLVEMNPAIPLPEK